MVTPIRHIPPIPRVNSGCSPDSVACGSIDSMQTATSPKRSQKKKKQKKKKKPKKRHPTNVSEMDMDTFSALLESFGNTPSTSSRQTHQILDRSEEAVRFYTMNLKRRVFAALRRPPTSPEAQSAKPVFFLPTRPIYIMTELLKHSYTRMHSTTYEEVMKLCRRQQLAKLVQRHKGSVNAKDMPDRVVVEDDLPLSMKDASVDIVPLRRTEWYSPATYLWYYFDTVLPAKLMKERDARSLGTHWVFSRMDCQRAATWVDRVQFEGTSQKLPGAIEMKVHFRNLSASAFMNQMKLFVPTTLTTILLNLGYTMTQIVGYYILHLWKLYHTLSATKTLATQPDFQVYSAVPLELSWPRAMVLFMMAPLPATQSKFSFVPEPGATTYALPTSMLWAAAHFTSPCLRQIIQNAVYERTSLRINVHNLCHRSLTLTPISCLYWFEYWGYGMSKSIARTARHLDLLANSAARILFCLSGRGYGQKVVSDEWLMKFQPIVSRTVHHIVKLGLARRNYPPLQVDGTLETDIKIAPFDEEDACKKLRLHAYGLIMEIHTWFLNGTRTIKSDKCAYHQDSLYYIVRDGGDAVIELCAHWFDSVPDGSIAHKLLDEFVWLTRFYNVRGSEESTLLCHRSYLPKPPTPPPRLEASAMRFYRQQRALGPVWRCVEEIHSVFHKVTPAEAAGAIKTRAGATYSIKDMRATTSAYMTDVVARAIGPDMADSVQEVTETALMRVLHTIPSHKMMIIYLQQKLLGFDQASELTEFGFHSVIDQMLLITTAEELQTHQEEMMGFFSCLLLFVQGANDKCNNETDLSTNSMSVILEQVVSLANFWMQFTQLELDTTCQMVLEPFEEQWTYLRAELAVMRELRATPF